MGADSIGPSVASGVLMIGKSLAHYRITARIGRGGMGEVYRAHDTKLGRDVALKILPAEVAKDPRRRKRFELEARAIAALRHPNIVTLYAAEEDGENAFLAMELIEGEDLRSHLSSHTLDERAFLDLAIPLSDAVAAAHARGIAHRDLKPSNIMLEADGSPKILDFGLAKLVAQETDAGESDRTVEELTRAGSILGTVPYMSPEQLSGEAVDHRSDIFSLGIIFYEMVAGRHPFATSSEATTLSSILRDEPPGLETLAPQHSHELRRVIARCLRKQPGKRIQSAAEIRDQLIAIRDKAPARAEGRRTPRPAWALVLAALLGIALWSQRERLQGGRVEPPPPSPSRGLVATQLTSDVALEEWPAWAPDGNGFVCSEEGERVRGLVLHLPAQRRKETLSSGSHDQIQATWSPGGEAVAFVRARMPDHRLIPTDVYGHFSGGGDIWTLDPETGEASLLVEDAFHPSYSPDGERLAFDAEWVGARRIWTADDRGRNQRQVSTDDSEAIVHSSPAWSPNERWIAYRIIETTRSDIAVLDLESGQHWRVTDDQFQDLNPAWSPSGDTLYFSSNRAGGVNIWRVRLDSDGLRAGVAEQLTYGPGQDLQLSLSPDGSRLLYTILGLNSDIWRMPLDPRTAEALGEPEPLIASTKEDSRAAWSPDGSRIAFNSDRLGDMNIWLHDLDDESERPLTEGAGGDYQPSWSADSRWITFFSSRSGNPDIWRVDVESGELTQLTRHAALDTNPFPSPDGQWIAFQSDRGGRKEVWLLGADGGTPRMLSRTGTSDHFMRWTEDSRWIYFDDIGGGQVHRVDIETGTMESLEHIRGGSHMSLSPDGQAILDVSGHRILWLSPIAVGEPVLVYEMADLHTRLDYPMWSPDGRWVAFDAVRPSGGDIWMLKP